MPKKPTVATKSVFYPLTVTALRRDTRDSLVLSLCANDNDAKHFHFKAGQYLTIRARVNGVELRRSYSICASENTPEIRIGIKKVADGEFSSWIHEHAHLGQVLHAMAPQGQFTVELKPSNKIHYLGFAMGSGITPILGILKSVLETEAKSHFTLIYGNRASNSIMFKEELADLKNQYLGRFNLIHVMSREPQDIDLFNGRIDKDKCLALFRQWVNIEHIDQYLICGSHAMTEQVISALTACDQEKSRICFELFATAVNAEKVAARRQARSKKEDDLCVATIIIDGYAKELKLQKNQLSLLDAALKEGMDLPHACKGGICSTCKAMLTEGEVDMDANFVLEDYEINRGYILCCQSYPVSKKLVINFDC